MSKRPKSDVANVVEIGSSDEEEREVAVTDPCPAPATIPPRPPPTGESRCFWKAGAYDAISNPAPVAEGR